MSAANTGGYARWVCRSTALSRAVGTVTAAMVVATGVLVMPASASADPVVAPEAVDSAATGDVADDAVSARVRARSTGRPVEVLGERTESSSTWVLPDGTMRTGMAAGPIWVKTGEGDAVTDWAEVDLTLQQQVDGSIAPVAHPRGLVLSGARAEGSTRSLARFEVAEGEVLDLQWPGVLPEPRLEGPRAVYPDVRPDVDLVLEATRSGVEQFFVLKERPAPGAELDLSVEVAAPSLQSRVDDAGNVEYVDAEGVEVAATGTPQVWDARVDKERAHPLTGPWQAHPGEDTTLAPQPGASAATAAKAPGKGGAAPKMPPGRSVVNPGDGRAADPAAKQARASRTRPVPAAPERSEGGRTSFDLAPEEAFLQDPAVEYPVVVDPGVDWVEGSFDTWIQSGLSGDQSGSTELRLGTYNGGGNVARSFINLDVSKFRGKLITHANLSLWNWHSWSCTPANWEVHEVWPPATTATRESSQPTFYGRYGLSNQTKGYSGSCGQGWVAADVTGLIQRYANIGAVTGAIAIKAEAETSSSSWKKFNSGNAGSAVPTLYVDYNTVPATPTAVGFSPAGESAGGAMVVASLTPTVKATLSDAEDQLLNATFLLKHNGNLISSKQVDGVPNGWNATWQIPAGLLNQGQTYSIEVQTTDGRHGSPYTFPHYFRPDLTAPGAPTVASALYVNDTTWRGAGGTAGTFTMSQAGASDAVAYYKWGLDGAPSTRVNAAADGSASASVTPPTDGKHVLQVLAFDAAGNASSLIRYVFYVGRAGLSSPEEGDRVVRRARLGVGGANDLTHVQFWYRRGPDALTATQIHQIPLGNLKRPDGTTLTGEWTARADLAGSCPEAAPAQGSPTQTFCEQTGGYALWDAGATLGVAGGPVQVQARFAKSATGAEATSSSQWVTLVVDGDADGAATSEIGPASVNLLTGDATVTVTDTEEFGVSIGRTASSRSPTAGWEPQAEALRPSQQTVTTTAILNDFDSFGLTMARSTSKGRPSTTTGLDSLALFGDGMNTPDTFAIPKGTGPFLHGTAPGRRFRASAWVYVVADSNTVPAPDSARGLSIVGFHRRPDLSYGEVRSGRPLVANAWQQVSVDLQVPADATEAFFRFYSGYSGTKTSQYVYWDDLSVREVVAPFGPQWSLAAANAAAGTAYHKLSFPEPDLALLHMSGGGEVGFLGGGGAGGGVWYPEPGAEDLKLSQPNPSTWRVTELDGTVTHFTRASAASPWLVSSTSPPVDDGQARYVYTTPAPGVRRLSRIIAAPEPGVDNWPTNAQACTQDPLPTGCEVLELVYAASTTATSTALGDVKDQVKEVRAWSWDGGATSSITVVAYRYDLDGRLREVRDPRVQQANQAAYPTDPVKASQTQSTAYGYDTVGRLTGLTPPGEQPWTFTYGQAGAMTTGSDDIVDANTGRLLTVSRPTLTTARPGSPGFNTVPTTDSSISTSVVYRVPTTRAAGGPLDMNGTAVAAWGQVEAPSDATAVFGPDTPVASATASATVPGANGYARATVTYLDASGRDLNVATPTPAGVTAGYVDTIERDRFGNVVRSLDATSRLLALNALPDSSARLGELGLSGSPTAVRALALSTISRYSADGLDKLEQFGPVQRLAVGNNPDDMRIVRDYSKTEYDQGKPDGAAYHLPTRETEAVLLADNTLVDVMVTENRYSPLDPAVPARDKTSGWVHGQPTSVTVDAAGPRPVTAGVVYDIRGRALESRAAGATPGDAATVRSAFYTAGAHPTDPACGSRPAWAGQACKTWNAGPASGHDPARMGAALPVKHVTSYDRWGEPLTVTESASGPVAGVTGTVTQSRTSTTTYDAAGRVTQVALAGTGAGMDGAAALPVTTTTYDAASGDAVTVSTAAAGLTTNVRKQFDSLGRLARYEDGTGAWFDTVFDTQGRPVETVDSLGTSTRTEYDLAKEPRGFATAVVDSVAGRIEATYDPDGTVVQQRLPGDVVLDVTLDAARVPVGRTYTGPDGPDTGTTRDVIAASTVVENGAGQWVRHSTTGADKRYAYDRLGRLDTVTDIVAAGAGAVCTVRTYTYGDRAQRTSRTITSNGTSTCPTTSTTPGQTTTYAYDTADRLVSTSGTGGTTWRYDPLGRITAMPASPGSAVVATNSYFVNDLIARQEVPGVQRMSWTLDPLQRHSQFTSEVWGGAAWLNAVTKANHYDSDGDSPAWIAEDLTLPSEVTRYVDGLDGTLAVQTGKTGARELQLSDLHGDVIATVGIRDAHTTIDLTSYRAFVSDEFGAPTDLSTGTAKTTNGRAPTERYDWLGGHQRSSEALGGVLLMGVRLYHPDTGRFLSRDPVPGGNATSYDYCSADPVTCTDLDGRWSWKGVLKKTAIIASVAAIIPGPIGAAASGVAAVAYAATGNPRRAHPD